MKELEALLDEEKITYINFHTTTYYKGIHMEVMVYEIKEENK